MICPKCVTSISDDSRYCPQCGDPTTLAEESHTQEFPAESSVAASPAPVATAGHLALTLASEVTPLSPEEVHNLLSKANLCRMRQQWSDGIDYCVAVLQAQPGNQTAHSLLGDIYRDQGKLDDAIQWVRLAVDLKPNPSDIAKLDKMEAERAHLMSIGDSRLLGSGLPRRPNDASVTGTTNLMGVSPRKWLNGMTLGAAGFLGAVILVLLMMRGGKSAPAAKVSSGLMPSYSSQDDSLLPPAAPMPRISNGMSRTPSSGSDPSRGLPADRNSAHRGASANGASPGSGGDMQTAPVLNVRPAPNKPAPGGTLPTRTARGNGDSTTLPGGMNIARVVPNASPAQVVIDAPVSSTAEIRPDVRDMMIRNVYRAARSVFEAYGSVRSVSIIVQSNSNDAPLMSASVDRATMNGNDPDTTPVSNLEDSLPSLRWFDGTQTQASASER